jgi:tetratricopeptide (TPR) repeat protein
MKKVYCMIWACLFSACLTAQTSKEWFEQGIKAQAEKDDSKALECFEKTVALDKNNAEAYAQLAWSLIRLEKYSKSLSAIKNAQKLSPQEVKYMYYQAVALDSMGRTREALEVSGKGMKQNSNIAELYVLRGNIYLRQKEYNTAIANLNKAIEIDRKNALAYFKRGYARYRVVDSQGACGDWRIASQLGIQEAQKFLDENCKE